MRGAIARADSAALMDLLTSSPWPTEALQLVGDAVLVVVPSRTSEASELARGCAAALGQRGWEGDAELATALAAACGDGPTPMLRPVPVDLEELASVLEGDPVHGGGRIDLRNGEVWPHSVFDDFTDDDEEEDETRTTRPGCGWTRKVRVRGTATWSCSSTPSMTPPWPTA